MSRGGTEIRRGEEWRRGGEREPKERRGREGVPGDEERRKGDEERR